MTSLSELRAEHGRRVGSGQIGLLLAFARELTVQARDHYRDPAEFDLLRWVNESQHRVLARIASLQSGEAEESFPGESLFDVLEDLAQDARQRQALENSAQRALRRIQPG